jgi:hypothetical protein
MSKYLISTTETYRVDSEDEGTQLIDKAKKDNAFVLSKYTSVYKEVKQKGECIDSYYKITLTKVFDDEREPEGSTTVMYDTSAY